MSQRPSSSWAAACLDPFLACTLGIILTLLTFRAGRFLTFDGYHYVEFTKLFANTWPDRFGNHWPFGWPLAGGLLGRLGLSAYPALLLLSIFSLITLIVIAARALTGHRLRLAGLLALASAPIIASELGSVLTELPFAVILFGLALALAHSPAPRAWWGAAALTVAALCVRYAGLIALAALLTWCAVEWRRFASRERLHAVFACFSASLLVVMFLGINRVVTGSVSGAGRGVSTGLAGLLPNLSDFGWSLPSALLADGVRTRFAPSTAPGIVVGASLFCALAAIFVIAWLRPNSPQDRTLALVGLGYTTGMVVLRCVGEFDALYSARTFLPAFAPALILLITRFRAHPQILSTMLACLCLAGFVSALHGASRQIGGDVRPAVPLLRARLHPDDLVAINDDAFSLSSYIPNRTIRVWTEYWKDDTPARFLVIASKPLNRSGNADPLPDTWRILFQRQIESGHFRLLLDTPTLVVLERVGLVP